MTVYNTGSTQQARDVDHQEYSKVITSVSFVLIGEQLFHKILSGLIALHLMWSKSH